jgi:hypothetical protein
MRVHTAKTPALPGFALKGKHEKSTLMLNKTDAAFLDDSMHVPLGAIRTHEATRQNPRVVVGWNGKGS